MGDAISHSVFLGVVIGYVIGIPLSVGAFFAGLLCAISVGFIKNYCRVKEDTVIGVVFFRNVCIRSCDILKGSDRSASFTCAFWQYFGHYF